MDRQPMNTMARRELEDWIVAECYRVASGAAAPAGWIEPRGMRDGDWYCFEHSGAHERSIFFSEILLNYFRLEPSGPYIPGSRSNECFADSAAFRAAAAECRQALARLVAEGVLVHASAGGYRLATPWIDLISACQGDRVAGRAVAEHCGRCHERA